MPFSRHELALDVTGLVNTESKVETTPAARLVGNRCALSFSTYLGSCPYKKRTSRHAWTGLNVKPYPDLGTAGVLLTGARHAD